MASLGVRNNNAGNLEASPWSQSQPGYTGSDGRFAQFDTPENGLNALNALLTNKYTKGLTTPRQIIGSWAPASDGNNVDAYSKYVGSAAGLGPDDPLKPEHLPAVASAIARYESPGALSSPGGKPQMASSAATPLDPNNQGALNTQQMYGPGALQNGGQVPPNAFGSGGVGDTLQGVGAWLQAANNPGGAASLLEQAGARRKQELAMQTQFMPKPMSMGTDPLTGKIKYGLFDPRTNTMTPMQGNGQGSNPQQGQFASDGSDMTDALEAHRTGKLDTPGLVKAAGPMVATEAQALIDGKANPANLGNRNPMLRQGAVNLAHVLDPNFNENQIPARAKIVSSQLSSAQGTFGGTINNAQAVAGHAADYMDAARKLQELQIADGASSDVNWVQNFLKSHSTDTRFKSLINGMKVDSDYLAGEGVKSATGGPGSMTDRLSLNSTMDPSKSLPEKQQAVAKVLDAMHARLAGHVNQYNDAFGLTGKPGERSVESFLGKEAQGNINNVLSTADPSIQRAAPGATPAPTFTGRTAKSNKGGPPLRETSDGNWIP